MSLVLTDVGEKLEITAGVTIPFTVHYADYVGATPVFTPGVIGDDTIVGTTDLLAAPASGQRVVRTITVFNDSGGADTITIQLDDGGVNYTIVTAILPDDYALYYDEDGWKVLDDTGSILTVLVGNTTQHDILSASHADAAVDAVTQGSLIFGNATPKWDELVIGGIGDFLWVNAAGTEPEWHALVAANIPAHALLGAQHSDTTTDAPTRGSIIYGNATPLWDELVHPGTAYHLQTDANDVVWSQNITMANGNWVGIGAGLERIVFDAAGTVTVAGANLVVGIVQTAAGSLTLDPANHVVQLWDGTNNFVFDMYAAGVLKVKLDAAGDSRIAGGKFGIGAAPAYDFDVQADVANYAARIKNDGNNDNRAGLNIECGADANTSVKFIDFRDGNGTLVGWAVGDGGVGITYHSVSDVRSKNVLGPVDQDLAIEALTKVNSIQYVGKGLTKATGRKNVGFSAQDIHQYFPEVATLDEKSGLYSIAYERLVPILWAQNQVLLTRIERLEAK